MVRLRTLTEKSTLGFGMFSDLKVGNLIRTNPQYLIWVYFHIERLNYSEGVIKAIGLGEHKIKKPGIDYDYFDTNCKLWGCRPASKRKYGIDNMELQSRGTLQFKQRIGTKSIIE